MKTELRIMPPERTSRTRPIPSAPILAHFTRASSRSSALDNLVRILEDGAISGSSRMVTGNRRAVCMFDAPFSELYQLLSRKNRRRYEPFGLAIEKRYAFSMGARPVIYLPLSEATAIIPSEEMWRVVRLELDRVPPLDWSFEREWRLLGDLPLESRFIVALVETWADAEEIYDRFGGKPPCAGVIPLREMLGLS